MFLQIFLLDTIFFLLLCIFIALMYLINLVQSSEDDYTDHCNPKHR